MTLFLHVGFPKTGTTSIQTTLHRASDMLRKNHSINYPKFASNHWMIALPFLGDGRWGRLERQLKRSGQSRRDLHRQGEIVLEEFRRTQPQFRHGILSSEHFIALDAKAIGGLLAQLMSVTPDVKVVVYVRHPADELSSRLQQNIKTGARRFNEIDNIENKAELQFHNILDACGKENLIVRRFGRKYFYNSDLIDDFISLVDPSISFSSIQKERKNESLTLPALFLIEKLYILSGNSFTIKNRKRFEAMVSPIRGPKFLAPRHLVDQYVRDHKNYMDFLRSEFDIVFDDVDLDQFPERLSHEFSEDTLESIAAVIMKEHYTSRSSIGRNIRRLFRRWS